MLYSLLAAFTVLLGLMLGWIQVQRMARRVAEQHPEAGPLRLIGGGCGGQGHGEPPPSPTPPTGRRAVVPLVAANAPAPAGAGGCEACSNTACKPGALPGATEAGACGIGT